MGDVYRYAFLTLFVLDATDCHQGILYLDPQSTPNLARWKAAMNYLSCNIKRRYSKPPLCIIGLALYKRGSFHPESSIMGSKSPSGNVWLTPQERAVQRSDPIDHRYIHVHTTNVLIIQHGESPSLPIAPSDWHIIVVEYTRWYLTKPTDKLAALAGLASVFQANTGFAYLAGSGKKTSVMVSCGCRISSDQAVRHSEFAGPGPSWSWISSRFSVLYITVTKSNDSPLRSVLNIQIVGYTIMHNNSNPMSDLLSASITVQAESKTFSYCSYANGTYVYDGKIRGNVFLDSVEDYMPTRKPCTVLRIADRELCTPDYERNDTNPGRPSKYSFGRTF